MVRRELGLHPRLAAADLYKLIYQAVFGIDHLLERPTCLRDDLLVEWAGIRPETFGAIPALQVIDPDGRTVRLHLGPLKARGVEALEVCELVARQRAKGGLPERFHRLWSHLVGLAAEGRLSVSSDELLVYRLLPDAPRHSPAYGPAAYRVLNDIRSPEARSAIRRWGVSGP